MTDRFIAMLALERPAAAGADQLAAQIKRQFPNAVPAGKSVEVRSSQAAPDGPIIMDLGGTLITVLFIDKPIPEEALSNAIRVDRMWPEAAQRLATHRAHAIVATLSEAEGFEQARTGAQTVTLAAAALCALMPTIGVYWDAGDTVVEASRFRESAQAMTQGRIPADMWIQFLWLDGPKTPAGERTLAVVTTGLAPFVGREIEFQPAPLPPAVIAERVLGTIVYLLMNGPVLNDGDTLGVSESERIRTRHRPSGQRPNLPIMALSVERLDSSSH